MTGEVILDSYGDREPDYWVTERNVYKRNGTFIKVAEVLNIGLNNRVSFFRAGTCYIGCALMYVVLFICVQAKLEDRRCILVDKVIFVLFGIL